MPITRPLYPTLQASLEDAIRQTPSAERREVLQPLLNYLQHTLKAGQTPCLSMICTHNSRRSQMAQLWAAAAAWAFGLDIRVFSGGVEVTAFHPNALRALREQGFHISGEEGSNPVYEVSVAPEAPSFQAFSKVFDHPANACASFAASMTCSHADENCPFIPGAEVRIPVRYADPKSADGTPDEQVQYLHTARTIASEMAWVCSNLQLP